MSAIKYDDIRLFEEYLRQHNEEVYRRMFYKFTTAQLVRPFEGVKGELVLTEMQVVGNLARRWRKEFDALPDVLRPKPRTLRAGLNKVDLLVTAQEAEVKGYTAHLRKTGQSFTDFPFAAWVLEPVFDKLQEEFEDAIWNGVETSTPAAGDALSITFNGFLKLAKDAGVAGNATVVATGAFTSTNAYQKIKDMLAPAHKTLKRGGTDVFMSFETFEKYVDAYKAAHNQNDPSYVDMKEVGYNGIRYNGHGGNTMIIPVEGITGDKVVITNRQNLAYGFDSMADSTNWKTQEFDRSMKFMLDFRMGAQILLQQPGFLIVNDQL